MVSDNSITPVWKPRNIKSTDIVNLVKSKYSLKTGHAGTLDPFAEGVLLICTGSKTKEVPSIHKLNKTYLAKIKLGERTDTLDVDGEIIQTKKVPQINKSALIKTLRSFEGDVMQRPPSFSAIRRNSVRLYELARKDIYVQVKPRKVIIEKITLISFSLNTLEIEVTCATGTYIRSLARDIGVSLKTCAYLKSLVRTRIGDFKHKNCISFKSIKNDRV